MVLPNLSGLSLGRFKRCPPVNVGLDCPLQAGTFKVFGDPICAICVEPTDFPFGGLSNEEKAVYSELPIPERSQYLEGLRLANPGRFAIELVEQDGRQYHRICLAGWFRRRQAEHVAPDDPQTRRPIPQPTVDRLLAFYQSFAAANPDLFAAAAAPPLPLPGPLPEPNTQAFYTRLWNELVPDQLDDEELPWVHFYRQLLLVTNPLNNPLNNPAELNAQQQINLANEIVRLCRQVDYYIHVNPQEENGELDASIYRFINRATQGIRRGFPETIGQYILVRNDAPVFDNEGYRLHEAYPTEINLVGGNAPPGTPIRLITLSMASDDRRQGPMELIASTILRIRQVVDGTIQFVENEVDSYLADLVGLHRLAPDTQDAGDVPPGGLPRAIRDHVSVVTTATLNLLWTVNDAAGVGAYFRRSFTRGPVPQVVPARPSSLPFRSARPPVEEARYERAAEGSE